MTKKIFYGIFTVSCLTLLACIALIMGVMHRYYENEINTELKNMSNYIAQGINSSGMDYFKDINIASENRVTLVGKDGTVLYDNEADISTMDNHLDREEIEEAIKDGTGRSSRYSHTMSEKTTYYAVKLTDGSVIRVSSTRYTLWVLLCSMIQPLAVILAVSIILSVVLASRMSKRIVKPINDINIENPDLDVKYEELAPLLTRIQKQRIRIAEQMDELKRKQNEFSIITENMQEGFIFVDSRSEILSYNTSALRILGQEKATKNKSILTLNRSEAFRKSVEEALSGTHSEHLLEMDSLCYQIIANPVYNDKEISGAVIVILDVTEKEQREKLRREFTSNVSHELKTPLTSIYGVSEMLMTGMVKPEDISRFSKDIHDESGRMITLIEDIIKLSKLDENVEIFIKEKIDIYDIASSVKERLTMYAKSKDLKFEITGVSAVIEGIPSLLEEMIYNLVDNAIKYNRPDGYVRIYVRNTEYPEVTVEDSGIGIPKDSIGRVFERFYRVDKSHSKEIGGTGLGLSIVKHGAAIHNAEIIVDSVENSGTSITLRFNK